MMGFYDKLARCGWHPRPADVDAVLATLPMPRFCQAAPSLKDTGNRDVLHWRAEEKVLGKRLPAHNQTRGTCVSQGYGRGAQDLMFIEIAIKGESEEWRGQVATEPIYAGSRVEIGGGQLGNDDGSVGAWAAKWVQQYGILLRQKYGKWDFSEPNDELAAELGARGVGVPDELEPVAKEHPVKTISQCLTGEEAADGLCNWYPLPICSDQGFTEDRDRNGFCKPRGTWYHCMLARGHCVVKGNRPAVAIQQSWNGHSPTGNDRVTLESGEEITLPQGVFLIDLEVCDRMVSQGDSFFLSNFEGFPSQLDHVLI